ncbi:MAG: AMP-binding protein [Deltaproteobacteria bacterium]|nr:AMP-binding protein [Deltaproteobacteria bacterium]
MAGKDLSTVLKALPRLVLARETLGIIASVIHQWGAANTVRILVRSARRIGIINNLKHLFAFRLDLIVPHVLIAMWDVFAEREAIVTEGRRLTYRQLKERVFRLANGLQSLGMQPKDHFAELLYNGNEFFEALLAGSLIGCPMPFLNWHMQGTELAEAINRASPRILVFDEEFLPRVSAVRDMLPSVEHFVVVGDTVPEGMIGYEDLIRRSSNDDPRFNFIIALNPYTGGTTGTPKNVNYYDTIGYAFSDLSEAPAVPFDEYLWLLIKELSFVYWFGAARITDPITRNMRCLIPGPLYHAGTVAGWAPFLVLGSTAFPLRTFDPEKFLEVIEQERINWVFVVPTMLERVLQLPAEVRNRYDLRSMHSLICAAAPATPELKRAINEYFRERGCDKNVFMEYYGSSETAITSVLIPEDYEEKPRRYASVGKIRCAETGILDAGCDRWCPPGTEGKVVTRSVMTVGLKYRGTPEKADEAFRTVDGRRWFDDGLRGFMDEEGFLYLTGREKEMIISGGVNIFPNEIETVIKRYGKVADVGVVRYPDGDLGEVPAAVVQLRRGLHAEPGEIIEHCRSEGLHGLKLPRHVDFVDELPRHIDGKLIKRELEDRYWQGIERRG